MADADMEQGSVIEETPASSSNNGIPLDNNGADEFELDGIQEAADAQELEDIIWEVA